MNEFTMNIVRKLRGTVPSSSSGDCTEGSPHTQLGLMHLKKLFAEYTNPAHPLSVTERDEKLYSMLPLFCKVFGSSPICDMQQHSDKYWDVQAFCQQVSLLMVAEIRKRASSQSTETASSAIAKFLEIESCEESSNGWMLLSTLNLLAASEVGLVQKMSELSVPSTLVKCLYLFFDLPEIPQQEADKKDANSDFTPKERRILLQKIFVQLLVRLCSHRVPAEELARKDDLTLLFSTITSSCQVHNVMWRKSAAEVLMTLSRHGLTPPVIGYIHSKGCVAIGIKNMQGERELAPLELVEMFVTVFCFLKDSSEVSSILLEDFRQAQGYLFLSEFLLKFENDKSSDAQESVRNLVLMITSLCMCGYIELKPSQASTGSLFQMQGFSLPQPSGRGTSVRNIQAFHVLQSTFLKSGSPLLCTTILDAISSIYHADNANYFILENQNTLSQFTERIHHKPPDVQQKLFELVLFLVNHLNFVPCKELISMSIFLKTHSMNQPDCSVKCMQSLLEILKCHSLFKDVYREVGLLEVFVTCLNRYGNMLETRIHSHDYVFVIPSGQEQLGNLVIDGMVSLLAANSDNANVLRECGGAKSVHGLVAYQECRQKALGIVKELVFSAGGDEDMGQLIETLHSAPRNAYQLKTDVLRTIAACLKESHRSRTIFRKLNGFVNVISILVTLENALTIYPCSPDILSLIYHIFHTIGTAMRFEPANARHFHQEICQSTTTTTSSTNQQTNDNQQSTTANNNNISTAVQTNANTSAMLTVNISSTLCDAVRLLGCFSGLDDGGGMILGEMVEGELLTGVGINVAQQKGKVLEQVHQVWVDGILHMRIADDLPPIIAYATVIYRLLYDLALDLFDKPNIVNFITKSPNLSRQTSNEPPNVNNNSMTNKRLAVNSLNLVPPTPDPIIVHPGVIIAMLQLLPCLQSHHHQRYSTSPPATQPSPPPPLLSPSIVDQQRLHLQLYLGDIIKSLVRTERNQQAMCEAGFVAHLLRIGAAPLQREKHPLHPPLQYMLERLAAQSLEPIDLRRFLRLGDPLNCIGLDEDPPPGAEGSGGPVALTRIKTIVSMTTPRDGRAQSSSTMPPFVEFDMSAEGFGCLYLPSIAPQAINTGNVVTGVDTNVIGGIGTGDRIFPPQTGLSFSTWICVDKFSDPRTDPHCVRLLTIVRQLNNTRDEHLVCLSIILSARDKAIILSTQEKRFQDMNDRTQDDTTQPFSPSPTTSTHTARFLCPDILHEGHWHHLAIVLNRAVLKNSSLSLYVDGVDVHSRKMHYISQCPLGGGGSGAVGGVGGNSGVGSIYGFIGTPPVWRGWSRLCWKQGPCHLLEEVLTPSTVAHIYQLGPQYLGSLQAVILPPNLTANAATSFTNALLSAALTQQSGVAGVVGGGEPVQLVPEEKVVFGLNAKAVSPLTLSRIRKVYSRADSKSIAKQLGMSSHENATPIKILYNSAGHLAGSARTLGGVVIGYLGVRVFCPRPVATVVDTVGGCSLLLLLIARAQTIESLYAGVKALVCVVRTNRTAQLEMDRRRSYQTLAMLLKAKKHMLNSHILQIAFGLVGTVDSKRESGCIPNITAFQDLLCDLDIWHEAPGELLRTHLEHLYELAADTNEKRNNTWIMRDLQLVDKLLHITPSVKHPPTRHVLFLLLSALLGGGGGTGQVRQTDLLWFAQFIASTLPSSATPSEKSIILGDPNNQPNNDDREFEIDNILLRNRCLWLLHSLLFTNRNSMNIMLCDEISKTLGFDWILLFMQPHIHSSSMIISLRILVVLCSYPTLMNRFRDSLHTTAYLHRNSSDTPYSPRSLSQSLGSSMSHHSHHHNTTNIDTSVTGTIVAAAAEVITSSTSSVVITASGVLNVGAAERAGGVDNTCSDAGENTGEVVYVPGFQHLGWLLEGHLEVASAYYMVTALMMGQPGVKSLPKDETVYDLDSVWAFLWGGSGAPKVTLCADAVVVLLSMVRAILHSDQSTLPVWLKHHPMSIIQVLFQLYHNMPDFMPIFMSADVLGALASVLFPPSNKSESLDSSSGASTPAEDNHDSMIIVPHHHHHSTSSTGDSTHSSSALPLSGHPARQAIIDLIRAIVVDSLSLAVTSKTTSPVIDIALDACPATATSHQQVAYQTELLVTLMDHLLAADMLVGDQAAIPIVPLASAHIQNVTPNVFYVTARIVDKLWQSCLTRDPHEVFDFIVKLIGQAKRRSTNLSLEGLYRSLNRCILYLLSRPTESIADQMSVLEGLHKLTTNRLIIFGAGNHELDFIACLTFCLLQLTADMRIPIDLVHTRTVWHVNPSNVDVEHQDDRLNAHQARNLMAGAAIRVWEELYVCKKPAIEEVFKVTLVPSSSGGGGGKGGGGGAPELSAVREQLSEAAQKLWLTYIDAERKTTYRVPWELHNQIQSRIHKVAGGLTRLASRTKVVRGSKEDVQRARIRVTKQQAAHWVMNNVTMLKELCQLRRTHRLNSAQHQQRYVHQEWLLTEAELLRERGLWGPPLPSILDKWALDSTEGPHRMRKKLMRNDLFYRHYPYRGDGTGTGDCTSKGQARYKYASSHHSRLYHCALQRRNNPLPHSPSPIYPTPSSTSYNSQLAGSTEQQSVPCPHDDTTPASVIPQSSPPPISTSTNRTVIAPPPGTNSAEDERQLATLASTLPQLARIKSDPDDREDREDVGGDEEGGGGAKPDNKMLLRLLQANEKISYMYRCARIQGLDTAEGLLLFGLEHCYVVDGFTLLKNRDIRDIEQALPSSGYEPILPNPGSPSRSSGRRGEIRHCSKFSYDDIREVHKRRYLLQPIALEVFSGDGRNHLLAFPRKIRNKVYQRFMSTATGIADSARESVAGQKRTANVEQAAGLLSSLIGETSVTQRWVRGEISNFQYLMHLNTLAGRSYNDLMQYPVFPWILADYDSEQLDLTDPSTFRDFTRPMGAQSPERLAQFKKRYKKLFFFIIEINYFFGNLQYFDEFFLLEWDDPHGETPPYHYGIHYSSAMIVCSYLVRMEPFAQHFLRLQGGHFDLADRMFHSVREAWHSASRHNMADVKELIPEFFYLPEFFLNSNQFDLGAKQSGVVLGDIVLPPWAKQDPREFIRVHRMALECDYVSQNLHHWIDLIFGYKQQGQAAVDAVNVFHHLFYEGNVDIYNIDDPLKKNATIGFINNFGQIPKQLFKKLHPAKKIGTGNNRTSVIDSGASLVQAFSSPQPEKLFFHHLDNLRPSLQPIKEVKSPVGQILHLDTRSSSNNSSILAVEQNKVLIPPQYNRYVAWGFADHSLRIGHYDSDRAVFVSENIVQNAGEIVACVCPNVKMIVTAGTSTVVTIWEYDPRHKHLSVKHSLYAHTEAVTCLASSAAYNVLVSGSRDCSAAVWDLSRGVFVRQLRGHAGPIAAVAVNNLTGDIATCAATWLHLWSINGDELAKVNTCVGGADRMQQILCVSFSQTHEWDASNVIMTGSTDGVTRMWSIDYVQVPLPSSLTDEATSATDLPSTVITPPPSATMPVRPTPLHHSRLQKQLHVFVSNDSNSGSTATLVKSGSESSLVSDDGGGGNRRVGGDGSEVPGGEIEVSTKEWRSEQENEKETCSDTEEGKAPIPAVRRRRSRVYTGLRKSEGGASADNSSLEVDDGSGMRTSKSDTSLTDSFVIVPEAKKKTANPLNALRQGFKWQRQLVFRSKLTMHTAYDRKDNAEPASITALAVSKDHRTVFVGDARGRVFSFSVTEAPGRSTADHWLKDEGSDRCAGCTVKFTLYERRHHCRNCGQLFCGKCSRFESEISRLRILKPVRVCQRCYKSLKN